MSNYPFSFDNNITLPGVSGNTQEDIAITALRSAVFAIEIELGITPSGIYPDVRTRLDILESRIGFGVPPSIPNDGYVKSPLFIWNVPENVILSISTGDGYPTENRLPGSLYLRGDGYLNNQLYINTGTGGTPSTSWAPIQTDQFVASGDLKGTYLKQTVIGLQTKPLNNSLSTIGIIQDGYHLTWNFFGGGFWEAQTGFIPGRDLAAFSGPYGRTAQTVIGLQGTPLSTMVGTPNDGYALIYEAADGHWDQEPLAIVWHNSVAIGDGYVTRTNIRSNKLAQSPSVNASSLVGMINFGSSTNGTGGVSANYASILGGDRNSASGVIGFPLVVNGYSNSATDGYTTILNGNLNVASTEWATVLNGNGNTASAVQSTVVNGQANTATGSNSFVINGNTNAANANFSGILNGTNNSISASSIHAGIGFGTTNSITGGALSDYALILGGNNNIVNPTNPNGATNALIGTAASASAAGNYSVILNGVSNSIVTLSDYAVILSGITNVINNSSEFGLIGTGNNNSVTLHYATVLNGSLNTANGISAQIINGLNNSVTGQYSTMLNGTANVINNANGYSTILDGYNHSITGQGSLIGDGYNHTIAGNYSTILNGNFNTINGRNSTILNGAGNTMDAASSETTVLVGEQNMFTNSANATVAGSSNTFTNASQTFVVGTLNSVQSSTSFINGSSNTLAAGSSFTRIFGGFNSVSANSSIIFIDGNSNQTLNGATSSTILGSNNTVDTFSNMLIVGSSNYANSNSSLVMGQFGKSRVYGQMVHSVNTGFGTNRIGEAQFSRIVLDGYGNNASQFFLQTHDPTGSAANLSFQDGYSYEMSVRVLIVNNQTSPAAFPTVPVRFVFDILAHQEGGVLVLDDVNRTLQTQNITSWTVTIGTSGNQLTISVDTELAPFINGTGDNRRAIATVEWRELSRIT